MISSMILLIAQDVQLRIVNAKRNVSINIILKWYTLTLVSTVELSTLQLNNNRTQTHSLDS